jgi:hypothetical protein
VPYDNSKPSDNALQQAIQIVSDLLACGTEATTNSTQEGGIQIILLHVVEEIHLRIHNFYIGLRIIAGKPLKEYFGNRNCNESTTKNNDNSSGTDYCCRCSDYVHRITYYGTSKQTNCQISLK